MRSFHEFVDSKQYEAVAACLLNNGLDVYDFCETVLNLAEEDRLDEATLLNELGLRNMLGGLSNLAANVAGLGGVGKMAGNAVGNAAGNAAQAVGNKVNAGAGAVRQGMNAASQAVGDKFNAARQAVGNQVNAVKQGVGNAATAVGNKVSSGMNTIGQNFAQSKNTEQLKQAGNAIAALQKQLASIGYPPNFLQQTLAPLQAQLQKDLSGNSQLGHKIGSGMNMTPGAPVPQAARAPAGQAPISGAKQYGSLPMARRIG